MLSFLVILTARIVLSWLAGQSIGFLIASWCIRGAYASSGRATPRRTFWTGVLLWVSVWPEVLAWTISHIRRSACAPRHSAAFALLSGFASLIALVLAWIYQAQLPPLDALAILCSWLSVLLLPGWQGPQAAKEKERDECQ
jgi:hypothetical protein